MDRTECMRDRLNAGKMAPAEPRCVPECDRPPDTGDDMWDSTGDPGDMVGVQAGGDPEDISPISPGLNSGPASSSSPSQDEAEDARDWLDFSRLFPAAVDVEDCDDDWATDTPPPTSISFAVNNLIWICEVVSTHRCTV